MFGFGRKRERSPRSIGWDLHAHLIPSVDDGMRTIDEAAEAVRALAALGYEGCILTPHVYSDLYQNSRESLNEAFDRFRTELQSREISFGLELAAEYFADGHLISLAEARNLLSFGSNYVLIEFPYISEPLFWADALSAVTRAGYVPVIAHPERYRYFAADIQEWDSRFNAYPIEYQCDLGSLVGQYGREAAKTSKWFRDSGKAKFWGSDLHRPSQVERFIRQAVNELGRNGAVNPGLGTSTVHSGNVD